MALTEVPAVFQIAAIFFVARHVCREARRIFARAVLANAAAVE